jgi:uncharacterized secreted repeat protein (TIGR03808 family)
MIAPAAPRFGTRRTHLAPETPIMDRRKLLQWSGAASAVGAATALPECAGAAPATSSAFGLDAAQMGVRPGSPDDQSAALRRAIERAATARVPLVLPPGNYRAGGLKLPAGAQLTEFRGATRLVYGGGPSLIGADHADQVSLTGLTLDGLKRPLPPHEGLVYRGVRILDCSILGAGGHGMLLAGSEGEVAGTTITDAADVAIFTYDAAGLTLRGNSIANAGNNGIQIIRSAPGHDGTIVVDNRIENTLNREGGSGQYGNAVNAHRAGDVIVRGNIMRQCAFSAVRGNSASNLQITGNTVHQAGEVALYSESVSTAQSSPRTWSTVPRPEFRWRISTRAAASPRSRATSCAISSPRTPTRRPATSGASVSMSRPTPR